jgi:hypothetical protein
LDIKTPGFGSGSLSNEYGSATLPEAWTKLKGVEEHHLQVKWCILGNGSLKWFNEQTSLAIPKEIIQLGHVFRQTQTQPWRFLSIQSAIFKVLGFNKN